ncbi:MAG: hypothetical protein K5870_07085 [Lachnospiraceae bacterium]|nr:hypothetical protein [Lachnospiraceae bacterium]
MKGRKHKRKHNSPRINRKYKDRLFVFIFGREENKEWTLSLFNAVNGSDYTDSSAIEFNTLGNVLYMGMKNDVSFLISNQLNLYEHQSSYNPNMPLRMLEYTGNLYSGFIEEDGNNEYGSALITLPVPKLVVFYNGSKDIDDDRVIRLSDAFEEPYRSESDVEVRVRMININYGRNEALMKACNPLEGYSWFVEKVKQYSKAYRGRMMSSYDDDSKATRAMILSHAVDKSLNEMPDDYVIKDFLKKHRAEVVGMLRTEYDEVTIAEKFRQEGRREGIQEGMQKGIQEGIKKQRINTERERARADKAEARVKELEEQLAAMSK